MADASGKSDNEASDTQSSQLQKKTYRKMDAVDQAEQEEKEAQDALKAKDSLRKSKQSTVAKNIIGAAIDNEFGLLQQAETFVASKEFLDARDHINSLDFAKQPAVAE